MTTDVQAKRRAILIFMLNRSGVLNKISMLIRRKMYNVETITACTTSADGHQSDDTDPAGGQRSEYAPGGQAD